MNRRSKSTTPEPILQLQRQLEECRNCQPVRTKLPDLARQYGIYPVARPLRLDYMGLKKRVGEIRPPHRRKAAPAAFVEVVAAQPAALETCVIEFESARGTNMRIHWKSIHTARLDQPAGRLLTRGSCREVGEDGIVGPAHSSARQIPPRTQVAGDAAVQTTDHVMHRPEPPSRPDSAVAV